MKTFKHKSGVINFDGDPVIMGILNVTPDSFSDGGLYFSPDSAVDRALEMAKEGAGIIDIGAMSTRPGSSPITPDEEISRLSPVLPKISEISGAVISCDTVNPETADYALNHGASVINDVSGFFNPSMAAVVKKHKAGWVITHTGALGAEAKITYLDGVTKAVSDYFDYMNQKLSLFNIDGDYICFDPGFGFAKTASDNIELLKNLETLIRPDRVFLTALSRKRFIGEITNEPDAKKRLAGTLLGNIIAFKKGSDILRVHDVKETNDALKFIKALE